MKKKLTIKVFIFSSFFILVGNTIPSSGQGPRAITTKDGTGVYHISGKDVQELTCDSSLCQFGPKFTLTGQEFSRDSWPNVIPIPDSLATCSAPSAK